MFKKYLLVSLMVLLFFSCSSNKPKKNLSAKERLHYAMKKFKDGDYLDAKTEFRIIVLNFPGHSVSDTAQYYLAECHLKLKEYILAIAEYEKLLRMFSRSAFTDDAQYKIGYANYKLSPKYALDQTYTLKAIEELQKFIEDYPQSELVDDANKLLQKCREKLAKKEYKNGELYRKMGYYDAALIYFKTVIDEYYDTKFATDAQFWTAECLRREKKYDRAIEEFNRYLTKYPNGKRKAEVLKLLKQIEHNKTKLPTENNESAKQPTDILSNPLN